MTWLSSELLTLVCFGAGAYRTLKVLKDGEVDFDLLVFFAVLAALKLFANNFEFLVGWLPFYFVLKSTFLALLLVPRLRLHQIAFHTTIIPGMTYAHARLSAELPKGLALVEALPRM